MRLLCILLVKVSRFFLKMIGRGSSLPGKLALKLCPNILKKIELPKYIIAVTGSNGKTSTVEMIYAILKKAGVACVYNAEGSNQIDGVATLILNNCDFKGHFKSEVLLLESDERYAQYSFKYVVPTHYVITNLYRDQMTRNGNPEFVLNEIKKSIKDESLLILNADDPIINSLGNKKSVYFGVDDETYAKKENDFVYDDGKYCPKCHQPLIYKIHQFGHVGKYSCSSCSFKRQDCQYYVNKINLNEGYIEINKQSRIDLAFKSTFNIYNILAAYSVASLIGIKEDIIVAALNNYLIKNGRVKRFKLGVCQGTLLISKHENSVSYNQNIDYVLSKKEDVAVLFMVDAISRKYFTSETSWLWDISFEKLNDSHIKNIYVTGLYGNDVATRLSYSGLDMEKVVIESDISKMINYLKENGKNYLYVLTCFSDEYKFMREVETL